MRLLRDKVTIPAHQQIVTMKMQMYNVITCSVNQEGRHYMGYLTGR